MIIRTAITNHRCFIETNFVNEYSGVAINEPILIEIARTKFRDFLLEQFQIDLSSELSNGIYVANNAILELNQFEGDVVQWLVLRHT